MTGREKRLYHQIHPIKLATDISTGVITTYLLWRHNIIWFLLLFLLPSVIASLLLIRFVDLGKLKGSRLGKYIGRYMTPVIESIRLTGQMIMWLGGWFHSLILVFLGMAVILSAWSNGILFPRMTGKRRAG